MVILNKESSWSIISVTERMRTGEQTLHLSVRSLMSFARAVSVKQSFPCGKTREAAEPWAIAGELRNEPLKFLTWPRKGLKWPWWGSLGCQVNTVISSGCHGVGKCGKHSCKVIAMEVKLQFRGSKQRNGGRGCKYREFFQDIGQWRNREGIDWF